MKKYFKEFLSRTPCHSDYTSPIEVKPENKDYVYHKIYLDLARPFHVVPNIDHMDEESGCNLWFEDESVFWVQDTIQEMIKICRQVEVYLRSQ